MAQMRAIMTRKKAAQKIRKITHAMAIIASVRLQKLQMRALAAKAYAQKLREMVSNAAANVGELRNPLLRQPAVEEAAKRVAVLVITSNRGLAGAYNSNVLRTATAFLSACQPGSSGLPSERRGPLIRRGASCIERHARIGDRRAIRAQS